MDKQIRVAIIGQGRSGRDIHGAYFLRNTTGHYKVVAVVDAIEYRRERAAKEFGCDVYADYKTLLTRKDIDLVVNATYSYEHFPITLDLLQHGFNVLTEKPFANRAADCDEMIAAAEKAGVKLAVFQNSRFNPAYMKIKEVLASGVLGDIAQIRLNWSGFSRRWDWQCSQRYGGGSLFNTCPHPMDQALELLGWDSEVTVAYSKLGCYATSGDAEDYVKVLLTAPGKPLIDLECSSICDNDPWNYSIHGSLGTLRATTSVVEWKYYRPELAPVRPLILESLEHEDRTPAYCGEKLAWCTNRFETTGNPYCEAEDGYYDMLYKYLALGGEQIVKPCQSRKQIALMEQIHAANPLPVKY